MKIDGDGYHLSQRAKFAFMKIKEDARFGFENGAVKPQTYHYLFDRWANKKERRFGFNWDKGTAESQLSGKPWSVAVPPGSVDKLSAQFQLRQFLAQQGDAFETASFTIPDNGKLKQYQVTKTGEETVETALGELDTIVLRYHREGSSRTTTFWLAKDWAYLIVKLEQIEKGGKAYSLALREASIGGQAVIGR